jgi:hypothetical protein
MVCQNGTRVIRRFETYKEKKSKNFRIMIELTLKENNEIRKAEILNVNDTTKSILSSTSFEGSDERNHDYRSSVATQNQSDKQLPVAGKV